MSHFAEIQDGIVTRVLVVANDQQHRGQEFLADDLGLGGVWIQTSYNTHANTHQYGGVPLHKNYAGIGFTWDGIGFAPPQCHTEATLNQETYLWDCTNTDHDIKEINE